MRGQHRSGPHQHSGDLILVLSAHALVSCVGNEKPPASMRDWFIVINLPEFLHHQPRRRCRQFEVPPIAAASR